jgi:rubrerythrin
MKPKKRVYRPLTPEERAAKNEAARQRRAEERASRLRYTCGKCGRTFAVPDSSAPTVTEDARVFVVLGGRKVCEVCARSRFPRRYDPWAAIGNAP